MLPERSLIHETMLDLEYVVVRAAAAVVCNVTSVSNGHPRKQFAADIAAGAITTARRNEVHPSSVAASVVMDGALMVMVFSSKQSTNVLVMSVAWANEIHEKSRSALQLLKAELNNVAREVSRPVIFSRSSQPLNQCARLVGCAPPRSTSRNIAMSLNMLSCVLLGLPEYLTR